MRTSEFGYKQYIGPKWVGMKLLSERDENQENYFVELLGYHFL